MIWKSNLILEYTRIYTKSRDKSIFQRETKTSRRNREDDLAKITSTNRYQKIFFGKFYSCNNFCHTVANCKAQQSHKTLDITIQSRMNVRRDENPFNILTRFDVGCYKFHTFDHLAWKCQLSSIKQEEEDDEECGISLCAKKDKK